MNKRDESKYTMYVAVQVVCEAHRDKWSATPAFTRSFTLFSELITLIPSANAVSRKTTLGLTEDKQQKRQAICSVTAQVAAALFAYADETGQLALKADANHSYNGLIRMRDNGITAISRNILQLVRTHIAVLAEYGLSRETPEQLEKAIGAYEQAKPKVQKVRTETVIANQNLRDLYIQIDGLLENRLDKLMEGFRTSQAEFFRQYEKTRVLVYRRKKSVVPGSPGVKEL